MYLKIHAFAAVVGLQYLSTGLPSSSHGTSITLTDRMCLRTSGNLHLRQLPPTNRSATEIPTRPSTRPWTLEQIAYVLSAVEQWLLNTYRPLVSVLPVHNPSTAPMATSQIWTATLPVGLPLGDIDNLIGSSSGTEGQQGDIFASRVSLGGDCTGECMFQNVARSTGILLWSCVHHKYWLWLYTSLVQDALYLSTNDIHLNDTDRYMYWAITTWWSQRKLTWGVAGLELEPCLMMYVYAEEIQKWKWAWRMIRFNLCIT